VRTSVGVSKAYGLDPGVGVGFFGGIKGIDPKQDKRELALILAETIERSGMNSRADEVMQVIQSFAATTSRMSLSSPNLSAHAGSYSSLMSMGLPGMTSDVAAGILSQANASLMGMGGAGEAGQNFILSAFQRNGALNPIQAKALAAGGLFGTRASTFGKDSALGRYFGADATGLADGAGANVTNFDAIRTHLAGMGGDKWLQLEGAQRLYGLSSPQQAAALLMMNSSEFGGLKNSLTRAGVGVNAFNESGLQTLAKIGTATSMTGLTQAYAGMRSRTGKGALSAAEIGELDRAQATGDTEKFRDALIKIASTKDREETQYTIQQDQKAALEQIQINTGDKLIPIAQGIKDGVTATVDVLSRAFGIKSDYLKEQNPGMLGPQKGGASGAWGQTGGATGSWGAPPVATGSKADFIRQHAAGAAAAAAELGVDPKLLLAQAGLETGWGRSVIPGSNNLGNIKAGKGWAGLTASAKDNMTGSVDSYRAYSSSSDYWKDYVSLIKRRYPGVVGAGNNASAFANGLTAGGYAEDPAYAQKIMEAYGGMTTLPGDAGGGRGFVNPSPVEVPVTLLFQNQQRQSVAEPASARVSIPRGAGTAR